MNEPGASVLSRSQVIALDPITISTGQKYFQKEQPLSEGITLGIKTILESKYIFLLVSGVHKSSIVAKVLEGEITAAIPGTALRNHPGLRVYLDQASASLLKTTTV
jgi:6-phosphogluconolactonase/glucosamine-6-phosphate isomerase/deaminase